MAFTIGTATFTNGSSSVTNVSLTSGRLSYFSSGTRMVVGTNPVVAEVEAIDAPAVNAITLREPWAFATGTYAFLANMTSEGVRDAVQTLRTYVDGLSVAPTADSTVVRTATGAVKVANAVNADEAVALGQLGTAATRNVGTSSGQLMEVGAFGVGGALPLYGGTADLNDQNTFHKFAAWFTAESVENGWSNGIFLTLKGNVTRYAQLGFTDSNDGLYVRSGLNIGNGGGWKTVVHTGNILTTTGQSTLYPMTQKAVTDAINGISDERDKTEINEIGLGLEVIENLKPVSFKLNKRDWYRQEAAKELIEVEEDGKITVQEKINSDVLNSPLSDFEENDGSLKRDDVYTGFIAQDLKETLEELGFGHFGIVKNYAEEYEGGEDRFYIEHLALLPFLVNSIKQLSARVKALEGRQGGEVE